MTYPASVATRQVSVGVPRDAQWNATTATVILTPAFDVAVDLLAGDVVLGTPKVITFAAGDPAAQVELLASDTPGLSVTSFDWRVQWLLPGGAARDYRVRIPRWTVGGTAPVLDLDLVAPVTVAGVPITSVPVVTPDALAAATSVVTANAQAATAYTLIASDAGRVVETTSATANTVTIPAATATPFPIGAVLEVCQAGAGQTTIAAAAGVSLRAPAGAKVAGQWASVVLRQRALDEWVLGGSTTT